MLHNNKIVDKDPCFEVDAITRAIKNVSSTKTTLMQFDHKSERFSFTLPRFIEGHDMMESTKVEVHFFNVDTPGLYTIEDLAIDDKDETKVKCTWLIAQDATLKVGALEFLLRFSCVAEDGSIEYAWSTGIHKGIAVSKGMFNTNVIVEPYADLLEQWRRQFIEAGNEPKDSIHLANGRRIESRKDGIYLVGIDEDGEPFEIVLCDSYGNIPSVIYAEEASFAYITEYAYMASDAENDADGRPLKGILIEEYADVENAEPYISDGNAVYYGIVSNSIIATKEDEIYTGFTYAMYFTTPSVIPENYTQFPADIYFKGDSTDEGAFVPEANMRYTIVFDFDGYMMNAYVSGVTTV